MSPFTQIQVLTISFLLLFSLTPLLFLSSHTFHCLSLSFLRFLFSISVLLSATSIFPFSFSALPAAPHCSFPNFFSPFAVFLPHLCVFPLSFYQLCAVLSPPPALLMFLFAFSCVLQASSNKLSEEGREKKIGKRNSKTLPNINRSVCVIGNIHWKPKWKNQKQPSII